MARILQVNHESGYLVLNGTNFACGMDSAGKNIFKKVLDNEDGKD